MAVPLKKIEYKITNVPVIPLLGIRVYPKELKMGIQRDICIPMLLLALFTTAKT